MLGCPVYTITVILRFSIHLFTHIHIYNYVYTISVIIRFSIDLFTHIHIYNYAYTFLYMLAALFTCLLLYYVQPLVYTLFIM